MSTKNYGNWLIVEVIATGKRVTFLLDHSVQIRQTRRTEDSAGYTEEPQWWHLTAGLGINSSARLHLTLKIHLTSVQSTAKQRTLPRALCVGKQVAHIINDILQNVERHSDITHPTTHQLQARPPTAEHRANESLMIYTVTDTDWSFVQLSAALLYRVVQKYKSSSFWHKYTPKLKEEASSVCQ